MPPVDPTRATRVRVVRAVDVSQIARATLLCVVGSTVLALGVLWLRWPEPSPPPVELTSAERAEVLAELADIDARWPEVTAPFHAAHPTADTPEFARLWAPIAELADTRDRLNDRLDPPRPEPVVPPLRLAFVLAVMAAVASTGTALLVIALPIGIRDPVIEVHRAGVRFLGTWVDLADVEDVREVGGRIVLTRLGAPPLATPRLVAPERYLAAIRTAMGQQAEIAQERAHRQAALAGLEPLRRTASD